MKILVTGASGIIGGHIYNHLLNFDYQVFKFPSSKVCDLTNYNQVKNYLQDKYFDLIIHCASTGGHRNEKDPWSIMDDNLKMYYNITDNRNNFERFLYLGSGADHFSDNEPYGFYKKVIRNSIKRKGNFYYLRIYNAFSCDELETRFIRANVTRYINKEPIIIYQDKYMDFIYIKDLCKIIDHYVIHKGAASEIDCVYNETHKLSQIAEIINNLSNYKVDVIIQDKQPGQGYCSFNKSIKLDYIGLSLGIEEVYKELLCKK